MSTWNLADVGPIRLPDGRSACRPHGLPICGICCVDFAYMDNPSEDDEEEFEREVKEIYERMSDDRRAEIDALWGSPFFSRASAPRTHSLDSDPVIVDETNPAIDIVRGRGRVFPTKFIPPSAASTPDGLFPDDGEQGVLARFIRRDDQEQALIYTDGACLDNGRGNAQAGWAFVTRLGSQGVVSGRLEKRGPFGDECLQTSNRAELRAVLGALRFGDWDGEGISSLVIATDSEYVAEGATRWARRWVRNGWKTSAGHDVKNKDLWVALLGEAERWEAMGLLIQFWRIPRELNRMADRAAKQSANEGRVPNHYRDLSGHAAG